MYDLYLSNEPKNIRIGQEHQETGKSYVAPTRGYGGYTHHVALSIVPIALVSLCSLDGSLGSCL